MSMTSDYLAALTAQDFTDMGYMAAHQLPDGRWAGVMPMLYTYGLFVGLDAVGYTCRYCYEHREQALLDLLTWDGTGDPPGPWVKYKGRGGDRLNPRLKDEAL